MSAMSRIYIDIRESYERGEAPAMIAQHLSVPIEFVEEVCDEFESEWDAYETE